MMSTSVEWNSPFTGGEVREIWTTEAYTADGQEYDVTAPCYECIDTGEQFTDNRQDDIFLRELHCLVRARRNGASQVTALYTK